MRLGKRLSCIADFVRPKAAVCDVGTDHGYLAIHLMQSGIASSVLAVDINEKPLNNAKQNIQRAETSGIELRLSDGLSAIKKGEADTFIIAGMGGEVISGILERGKEITQNRKISLVLQPTTSPEFLRRFLYDNGYEILAETPVAENGKIYSVMKVAYSGEGKEKNEGFYYIGKITPRSEEGILYIKKQQRRCFSCMKSLENIEDKKKEYTHYKSAFLYMENALNGEK